MLVKLNFFYQKLVSTLLLFYEYGYIFHTHKLLNSHPNVNRALSRITAVNCFDFLKLINLDGGDTSLTKIKDMADQVKQSDGTDLEGPTSSG